MSTAGSRASSTRLRSGRDGMVVSTTVRLSNGRASRRLGEPTRARQF
jgi:hypothetical protein